MTDIEPAAVRIMALGWLEAAEAAIHDAALFRILTTKVDVDPGVAAGLIRDLREHRADRTEDGHR